MEQKGWRLIVKKALDRSVAAVGLIACTPILSVTAVAVRATMGAPVFFRQRRPGHMGRPFEVVKFRTMRNAVNSDGTPLPDSERLTGVGNFLRRTSIDELPQLWNVLVGDLSLVGPRPLLMEYLERYTPDEMRRHDVLPGITGLPAVSGRNTLSWDDRFRLDLQYVDQWSLLLDAKILALTAYRVLERKGVSSDGHATSPELRPESTTSVRDQEASR
jgi:lipopolysaccharide/colanic/teichoic acid biosynthesis glycosyltransferase